jgi:hypothetical protein
VLKRTDRESIFPPPGIKRLETRNAYLEGELKIQEQHHTNALKEVTATLRQQLAKRR